jgi:hypothetical protein
MVTKQYRVEGVQMPGQGALGDVKETKEDFTSQIDFCSLLILEAH